MWPKARGLDGKQSVQNPGSAVLTPWPEVVHTIQEYVKHNPRPARCHVSPVTWRYMATDRITKWKTDVDFYWVAALAFGVKVYVWSLDQGTKVFTPSGDSPRILSDAEILTKTASSTDGWEGEIIIAFCRCHYFAMLPDIILPLKVDSVLRLPQVLRMWRREIRKVTRKCYD